ncbi:hypothetical protein [Mesorhizobium sp. M0715]|uniref:hypothetical protein n=1 Tax=Mesorhizobium sp. M0715 TaxID=2956990 RepID=UPI0033397A63
MDVIDEIKEALEFLEEHIELDDEEYISSFAHQAIIGMQCAFEEKYEFVAPDDSNDLLRQLIFIGEYTFGGVGVVKFSRKMAHLYVIVVSTLLYDGGYSVSLLGYLRLFVIVLELEPMLAIEKQGNDWFLISSPAFEQIYDTRMFVKIPEAVC